MGELLLNLSRAWELADTRTSNSIATQLPSIESYLMGNVKSGKDNWITLLMNTTCENKKNYTRNGLVCLTLRIELHMI